MKKIFLLLLLTLGMTATAGHRSDGVLQIRDLDVRMRQHNVVVMMQMLADDIDVSPNHQVFVTPYLEDSLHHSVQLPSVLFSGRNMHYVYLRSGQTKASGKTEYDICQEVRAYGNKKVNVDYAESIPLETWMLGTSARVTVAFDTCGCGRFEAGSLMEQPLALNPADRMRVLPYPVPMAEDEKIFVHHGRTRVQFEVDRTELHAEPYKCKRDGKILDNRAALQLIEDSLNYALKSHNVELHSLQICGYASPESPYKHNEELSLGRSKVLLEYIEQKFHLPVDRCTYSSVPENWGEFREMAADTTRTDITPRQRQDLLALIDRPIYGTSDLDDKERELKTSPTYRRVFYDVVLPEWFPLLRCTDFTIRTHLLPMTDEQLRELMRTEPELMSLNQFYRVALLYPHGSAAWHEVMALALKYYPHDKVANANAAAVAIEDHRYDDAWNYLDHAGEGDDTNILRGIVCTHRGQFEQARAYFQKALPNDTARQNLLLLE